VRLDEADRFEQLYQAGKNEMVMLHIYLQEAVVLQRLHQVGDCEEWLIETDKK